MNTGGVSRVTCFWGDKGSYRSACPARDSFGLRRLDAILLSARSNEPQRTLASRARRIVIARTVPITQYKAATLRDKKNLAGSAPSPRNPFKCSRPQSLTDLRLAEFVGAAHHRAPASEHQRGRRQPWPSPAAGSSSVQDLRHLSRRMHAYRASMEEQHDRGDGGSPYQRHPSTGPAGTAEGSSSRASCCTQGESNANDTEWPNKVAKIYRDLSRT